jgi:long-chain fatty acid transport protein
MAYEISGFTVGAIYKSEIKFDIDDVLQKTVTPFTRAASNGTREYTQDEMATPEQYGVGISYTNSGHTIAFDWKYINWEDAETYQDFGWEDQDVFAVGYQYATDKWALRCGYQYAESAVQEQTYSGVNSAGLSAGLVNTFNLLGFPGTQETHITFGGSYAFNETISVDLAAVYGLENEETYTNFMNQDIETKHSEQSYSVQLNYAF